MFCKICSEKNEGPSHEISEKHRKNLALLEYQTDKYKFVGNRRGIIVACDVKSSFGASINCVGAKVKISAKPNEVVTFMFTICNDSKKEDVNVQPAEILHNKCNFDINNHGLVWTEPQKLGPKMTLRNGVNVTFRSPNIGQYETSIIFKFTKANNENIIIIRDTVVFVEEKQTEHEKILSPYACKEVMAKSLLRSPGANHGKGLFLIPKGNKTVYLRNLKMDERCDEQTRVLADDIRKVFAIGVTKENYEKFFHNLLWYEETVIRVNIKKYNMSGVCLTRNGKVSYTLRVPGLAEKRPSLMIGDIMFVRPHNNEDFMFEAVITEINEDRAMISKLHHSFPKYYSSEAKYDIRFFVSRVPLERAHVAVHNVAGLGLLPRIFPQEHAVQYTAPTLQFYNTLISENPEQRMAVEHIVGGSSGTAPYLLHGPPGTGKTVTIVEAILQIVKRNPQNRILVCTDSNMAADHVATMIIKYAHLFAQDKLLLRANSKYRVWESLPECLKSYSNGTNRENFEPVTITKFMSYNIVVTTLSHAAQFGRQLSSVKKPRMVSHLFIDEAAQASEPNCLIPMSGLLAPTGRLVLAGDPHQLGPVVISYNASKYGLGISLMERLQKFPMYSTESCNPNYVVMLRNNFRSDKEIIDIPDKLFYKGQLRALAQKDYLSEVDILGVKKTSHAVVFHGTLSKEQKVGKSPSYFNTMECDVVKMYIEALVSKHKVSLEDIGIVTPYIRQVYRVKKMLRELGYEKIEVGTVEAFQGKEKRVIIISTVRANCNQLGHDEQFQLGFLVDDKRFNVAITRAKAKVIVIGNPLCLEKDIKWRAYIQKCRDMDTYLGFGSENEQNKDLLADIVTNKIRPLLAEMKVAGEPVPKK